jgi:hypothetical protein
VLAAMPRRQLARRACSLLAVASLLLMAPVSAQASTKTLARSVSNIFFAPLDILLSPVTAGKGEVEKLTDIEDTMGVRIAYAIPGYFWYTGVIMGAGAIRGLTGLIQFIPGVLLLPFQKDLDPLMDPVDRASALVEFDYELFPIKFGIDYTSAEF